MHVVYADYGTHLLAPLRLYLPISLFYKYVQNTFNS